MGENQSFTPLDHHGTPLLRILALLFFALLIAAISSLITYYFLNKQIQSQPQSYQQSTTEPVPSIAPSLSEQKSSNLYKPNIPKDWTTVKSNECNVIFPLPPPKAPYTYPKKNGDIDSGRIWKYHSESYKSTNGTSVESPAVDYLSQEEFGSDYRAGMTRVECQKNLGKTNQEIFEMIKPKQIEPGLGPFYTFKRNESKWGHDALVYEASGQVIMEHYIFSTGAFTYDVSYYSGSSNQTIKNTTKQIFDNLEFF